MRRGEVHALMGENGAGKSTLIKVLTGVYPRDAGHVTLNGVPLNVSAPIEAQHAGISTVYQEVNLVPYLSVAENIFLGRQPKRLGFIRWNELRARARAALKPLDLELDVSRPLASYSIAVQQMVAIARALEMQAKVLILDEPTSSLDAAEVERLFYLIRALKARDVAILFVTHFMDQVYQISDRITVLRNGCLVGEYVARDLPRIELISKMLGRDVESIEHEAAQVATDGAAAERKVFVEARGLGKSKSIMPFDLDISEGEVVGLAGLLGSGRTEIARLLFGLDRPDSGELRIDGRRAKLRSPRGALARRFALCPEDRKTQSIIPDLSVRENMILALQAKRGWLRKLSKRKQSEIVNRYIKAIGIKTPSPEQAIRNLSGGNQQKVILARWLASEPRLLILDEPTRGIDVGAKAEVEGLVRELAREGYAVVFISSELEEVVRSCNRVMVLRDRRKIGELEGEEVEEQRIMQTIAGGHESADA